MSSQPAPQRMSTAVKVAIWVLGVALVAVAGFIAFLFLDRAGTDTEPAPTPTPSAPPATSTPEPEPSSAAPTPSSAAPSPSPEQTESGPGATTGAPPSEPSAAQTLMWQGMATFEHFTVELMEDTGDGEFVEGKAGLPVEVCLTKALDGQDTTRVSLDPWTLEDSTGRVQQPQVPGSYEPAFPAEGTYAVGECASGYLTFDLITAEIDYAQLVYANGLGDRAVWQFH